MKKSIMMMCMVSAALCLSACGGPMQVLKQDIPVSTNPMGANILVDGNAAGVTPTTISLERNRDHIVTLVKQDYRQADVTVTRKYKETALADAINSGVQTGMFHNNPTMGVSSGLGAISNKEKSGEMFDLTPTVIKVDLAPSPGASGTPSPRPAGTAGQAAPVGPPVLDKGVVAREMLKAGVTAEASRMKPMEKKTTLSSSSSTTTRPDGTTVTKTKSSSASMSINPAGIAGLLDKLFK